MDLTKQIWQRLFIRFPELIVCQEALFDAFSALRECYTAGGKVLVCGNGGSAADAEHIVGELMKGFQLRRKIKREDREKLKLSAPGSFEYLAGNLQGALPAFSLVSQTALLSAFGNDIAPDMVYAQQVYGYARKGDILIAISTSGNSPNVIHAVMVAKAFEAGTIGLTGEEGGRLKEFCNILIKAPARETYKIQEYHLPIYHTLCAMLEVEFFGEPLG
jgi:D-sedoheptulose 7-phosphate isomerase